MPLSRLLAIAGLTVLATVSFAYRCPGKLCDFAELSSSDCASYVEVPQQDPMTPSSVPKKMVLIGGTKDETCDATANPLSLSISQSMQEQETVSVSGGVSTTVGGSMKVGIKDAVDFSGSMSGEVSTGNSYTFSSTFSFTVTSTNSINIPANSKGYLNAFVSKKSGSFSKAGRMIGAWDNPCGCYQMYCAETTGNGTGLGWGNVVHFRSRVLPCVCATTPTQPGGPD